ncbi:MAG: DUF11 domain-containing protein [Deltaproteobacteria bacterium]|nr:DUF11 domain-containing protein [Deltaproteobacteria bacterium]
MHTSRIFLSVAVACLLIPAVALAKPQVSISIKAEKKVIFVENGQEVVKRIPAVEVAPGETLIYTLTYTNAGDEAATNVVINDPIPQGAAYILDSASGQDTDISFSIDGGQTFKKPSMLTYEVKLADGTTEKRVASPEAYTHIRWTIRKVRAGGSGELGFQVRVK